MRVSIIVPVLNEAIGVRGVLTELEAQHPHELIVVDGGSRDATVKEAAAVADRVLVESGGLARQLNCGARHASGDVLLFSYADTKLPSGALQAMADCLKEPSVVGGAFRLGFDTDRWPFTLIARCANLRNRLGFGPFGDQGLFVRRTTFFEVGGVNPDAFLEDLELVRRLRRSGRFQILPKAVRTSTRRYLQEGLLKTLLVHWTMSAAYLVGKRRSGSLMGAWMRQLRTRR